MRPEELLNALVGANAQPGTERADAGKQRGFLENAFEMFGTRGDRPGGALDGLFSGGSGLFGHPSGTGGGLGDMLGQFFGRNPGLTGGALGGIAGLLLGSRSGSGLFGGLARMGGLALIGSLAYKAFRNWQQRRQGGEAGAEVDRSAMHPANATDDDAELYLRAMIAAIAADGKMDEGERARVSDGLKRAGVDEEGAQWISREFAKPATVEELALRVQTPEEATKVYTAARVAIDPDTDQERQFLDRLAAALKLDAQLRLEVDKSMAEVKVNA